MTVQESFVGNFLVRQPDPTVPLGWRLGTIAPLRLAPPTEQFISYLLQKNTLLATAALEQVNSGALTDQLVVEIFEGKLEALVYYLVGELGLQLQCAQLRLSSGVSLLDTLCRGAARSFAYFNYMDVQFEKLVNALQEFGGQVVWLKGTALSRTLYEEPFQRLSGDFDVVVSVDAAEAVFDRLRQIGFSLVWDDCLLPGLSPLLSLRLVSCGPLADATYSQEIQALQEGFTLIELKFDPLKSGIRMKELDRFFQQCERIEWKGAVFSAPAKVDHLMVEVFNLHRREFKLWPCLYDLHLLSLQLTGNDWQEFVRRCSDEGVAVSAWAALDLVRDRLNTPIPDFVLSALAPQRRDRLARIFTFVVGVRFLWNEKNIFALLINYCLLGDKARKWRLLSACLLPSSAFLSDYYGGGTPLSGLQYLGFLIAHWFVLLFSRSVVSSWIGPRLRRAQNLLDSGN